MPVETFNRLFSQELDNHNKYMRRIKEVHRDAGQMLDTGTSSESYNKRSEIWKSQLNSLYQVVDGSKPTIVLTGKNANLTVNSIFFSKEVIESRNMLSHCWYQITNKDHQEKIQLTVYSEDEKCSEVMLEDFSKLNEHIADTLETMNENKLCFSLEFYCKDFQDAEVIVFPDIDVLDNNEKFAQYLKHCIIYTHMFRFDINSATDKEAAEKELIQINELLTAAIRSQQEDRIFNQQQRNYWSFTPTLSFNYSKLCIFCHTKESDDTDDYKSYLLGKEGLVQQIFCAISKETDSCLHIVSEAIGEVSQTMTENLNKVAKKSLEHIRNQYAIKVKRYLGDIQKATSVWISDLTTRRNQENSETEKATKQSIEALKKSCITEEKLYKKLIDESLDSLAEKIKYYFSISGDQIVNQLKLAEIPSENVATFDELKKKVSSLINQKLKKELVKWSSSTGEVRKVNEEIIAWRTAKLNSLEKQASKISPLVVCFPSESLNESIVSDSVLTDSDDRKAHGRLAAREKVTMIVTAPFWLPLAVFTLVFTGPIFGYKFVNERKEQNKLLRTYNSNPEDRHALIKRLMHEALKTMDAKTIREQLLEGIHKYLHADLERFKSFIEKYCICPEDRDGSQCEKLTLEEKSSMLMKFNNIYENLLLQYRKAIRIDLIDLKNGVISSEEANSKYGLLVDQSITSMRLEGPIGNGAQAKVYSFTDLQNRTLAIKVISLDANNDYLMRASYEMQIFKHLRHGNIAEWLDNVYLTNIKCIGIITPKYSCNLRQYMYTDQQHTHQVDAPWIPLSFKGVDEERHRTAMRHIIENICIPIISGLNYLHAQKILHRDMKMENVLVDRNDQGTIGIRLIDFGCSIREDDISGDSYVGTKPFIAAECNIGRYYCQSDVYATGYIFWELYYGKDLRERHNLQCFKALSGFKPWDDVIHIMTDDDFQNRPLTGTLRLLLTDLINRL